MVRLDGATRLHPDGDGGGGDRGVEPIAAWIGGKRLLARAIIERIDRIPHRTYAEPFVGMGGVFLRRARKPKTEIINGNRRNSMISAEGGSLQWVARADKSRGLRPVL